MSSVQFIIFQLEQQQYGIEMNFVNGINKVKGFKISKIPNSPSFIEGIINLRGKVIPLYNLRKRFNLQQDDSFQNDEVLIAIINDTMIGLIVDEVMDIVKVEDTEIEATSTLFTGNFTSDFISSIAKINDEMVIILDAEKILTVEEQNIIMPLLKKESAKIEST